LTLAMKRVRGTPWAVVLSVDVHAMAPASRAFLKCPVACLLTATGCYARPKASQTPHYSQVLGQASQPLSPGIRRDISFGNHSVQPRLERGRRQAQVISPHHAGGVVAPEDIVDWPYPNGEERLPRQTGRGGPIVDTYHPDPARGATLNRPG
jgi:hypothetical protein